MLVILLVGALGKGAAFGLDSLQISRSQRLKSTLVDRTVGFAGVEVDQCNGRTNSDCC